MEFQDENALILEDSEPDYLILKQMLIELGFNKERISWASTLAEISYSDQTYVFCDLNLPDSEGKQTLKRVLHIINRKNSLVIVMTGLSDEMLAQESIQLGAQDYLIKGTFSKGLLRKTLIFSFERNRLFNNLNEKQKELTETQQYLSTILSTVPGVIIRFDKNLKIEYLNRPFFGYDNKEDFIGTSLMDYALEEDSKAGKKVLDKLINEGKTYMFEGKSTTRSNREFNVLYRASAIGDGTYILIATDITELIQSRDELQAQTNNAMATQLQLLSAQLNPHFLFNAMSSIQHSILYNDVETSLNFISSFSSLMRKVLENSRKELIQWTEEIGFLRNYLEIEQFRFEGSFDFAFEQTEACDPDRVLVPPMLVQPYLENTVVHGLANLTERKGKVNITLDEVDGRTLISIKDNGVGRKVAIAKRKLRTGGGHISRAMSISKQRLDLLNTLYNSKAFEVKVTDLEDKEGHPLGTQVDIYIPVDIELY